uniref:Uncharacterized protein n=1 Tax=Panagrolaimus sp. JU765 TaxID=591449 RepID=A0AC34Q282_9BILA
MSFPSNQVEIHHPNNDLTVITSDGCRHEHFYTQRGHYKEEHNYITSKRFYDDGTVEELDKNEERSSLRIDGSYVKTTWNEPIKEHTYFHPEFKVTRSDAEGLVGSISLKFYYPGTEQMQYIQVNICPEHAVAKVKHCSGIKGDKDYKSVLCTENSHCLHFMR